jgi:hypothetical protein
MLRDNMTLKIDRQVVWTDEATACSVLINCSLRRDDQSVAGPLANDSCGDSERRPLLCTLCA